MSSDLTFSVSEQRQWLEDYEADLFHIACLRCGAPFKHEHYAIAAPAEWFGMVIALREALDEIDSLREHVMELERANA